MICESSTLPTACILSQTPAVVKNFFPKPIKNAAGEPAADFICHRNQTARSTLLERRHLVQAYTWQGVPFTTALTRLTLGFHSRLERLWEWETLIPKVTPLPQKSHFAIHCTSHPNHYLHNLHPNRALRYHTRFRRKMQAFFSLFFEKVTADCPQATDCPVRTPHNAFHPLFFRKSG